MKTKTMRKSSVAMLAALGVLALITILMVGLMRVAVSRVDKGSVGTWDGTGNVVHAGTKYDLRDFRSISFIGAWKVNVVRGDEWEVDLDVPRDFEDDIEVEISGDELILDPGFHNSGHWDWWKWGGNDRKRFSARIVMPELDALNISGTTELDFRGFRGDSLSITISGAGNIEGDDGHYRDLVLTMSGAGNVDMEDMDFVDARVNLSGAGNVSLGMDGGVLSGNLSGFGNIRYYGKVKDERVHISGFGKVRNVD